MTHTEVEKKIEQMWNNAPIGYAFSRWQAKEMFEKWELDYDKEEDRKKVKCLGNGTYCLKTDLPKIMEIIEESKRLRKELENDKAEFAKQVYQYFCDYECMVTNSPDYALDALDFEPTEENKDIIRKQWKKFCKRNSCIYYDPFENPQTHSLE